jgi:hypothetical protein
MKDCDSYISPMKNNKSCLLQKKAGGKTQENSTTTFTEDIILLNKAFQNAVAPVVSNILFLREKPVFLSC